MNEKVLKENTIESEDITESSGAENPIYLNFMLTMLIKQTKQMKVKEKANLHKYK